MAELLRAPYDYCEPSVPIEIEKVPCIDDKGRENHIFGAAEIAKILDCSPTTSRAIMLKLKEIEVVEVVKGKGKGRYVFK